MVTGDVAAEKRRSRPQARQVEMDAVLKAWVSEDLKQAQVPIDGVDPEGYCVTTTNAWQQLLPCITDLLVSEGELL